MRIDLRVGISISSCGGFRVRHPIMFSPYSLPRNVLSLRFLRAHTHRPLELASKNARHVTGWRPYSSFPDIPGHGAGRDRAAVGVRFIFLFPSFICTNVVSRIQVFTPKAAALFVASGIGLYFYFRYEKEQLLLQRRMSLCSSLLLLLLIIGYITRRKRARSQNNRPSTRRRPVHPHDAS